MHENVLAQFFLKRLPATALASDVAGSTRQVSEIEQIVKIENMPGRFLVTREMAIALCDAVICGELPAEALETIGFSLVASDSFHWSEEDDEPGERSSTGLVLRLIMR